LPFALQRHNNIAINQKEYAEGPLALCDMGQTIRDIPGNGLCVRYNGTFQFLKYPGNITSVGNPHQCRPGTIFQTRETRQFTTS